MAKQGTQSKSRTSSKSSKGSRSKSSTASRKRKQPGRGSSKSGNSRQGQTTSGARNPSQEFKDKRGDEGHARVRPSDTRSVVERDGDDEELRASRADEFKDYSVKDPEKIEGGPDVLIAVPVVKVDEIDVEVDDLHAQVAVLAEVRKLVKIGVGVEAQLDKVED